MHDEDQSLVNIAENSTSLLIVHIYNFTPLAPQARPMHIGTFLWILTNIHKYPQLRPFGGGPLTAKF